MTDAWVESEASASPVSGVRLSPRLRPLHEAIGSAYRSWTAADDDPFGDADAAAAIEVLDGAVGAFLEGAAQDGADMQAVLGILAHRYPRLTHLESFEAQLETEDVRIEDLEWEATPGPVYWDQAGKPYAVVGGESVWLDGQFLGRYPWFEYVGFGRRFGARAVDLLFMYALAFCAAFALALVAALLGDEALTARMSDGVSFVAYAAAAVASLLFYVVAEAIYGSTPGKMAFGMVVRSEDGARCTAWQAVKRSLCFLVVDGFLWGIPGWACMRRSPIRQRIGDVWAKTVVVRTRSLPVEQRPPGERFVVALLAASLCYTAVITLGWIL